MHFEHYFFFKLNIISSSFNFLTIVSLFSTCNSITSNFASGFYRNIDILLTVWGMELDNPISRGALPRRCVPEKSLGKGGSRG